MFRSLKAAIQISIDLIFEPLTGPNLTRPARQLYRKRIDAPVIHFGQSGMPSTTRTGETRLVTKNGRVMRLSANLATAIHLESNCESAFDGEIVVSDSDGRPHFL
jgi:hypothetical protein